MKKAAWAVLGVALLISGCEIDPPVTYTLYRNSLTDPAMRVHWATFDANESGDYNGENCRMAVDLLSDNLKRLNGGVETGVRFWCEKGEYRA